MRGQNRSKNIGKRLFLGRQFPVGELMKLEMPFSSNVAVVLGYNAYLKLSKYIPKLFSRVGIKRIKVGAWKERNITYEYY